MPQPTVPLRTPHHRGSFLLFCSPKVRVNVEGAAIRSLDTGFHGFLWHLETAKKIFDVMLLALFSQFKVIKLNP
jgi:hypothetical protein